MSRRRPHADARSVALRTLAAIEDDAGFLQPTLEGAAKKARLDPRERALALQLCMGVARWEKRLDYALEPFVKRGLHKTQPDLRRILRLAVFQMVFLDRVPDRAAVHSAVDLARAAQGDGAARFTNGVLRAFLRTGETQVEGDDVASLSIRWSHPEWMIERWLAEGGVPLVNAAAAANNAPAPLTVRPAGSAPDRAALLARLEAEGAAVEPSVHTPDAVRFEGLRAPFSGASFREGWWVVQDEASQLVVQMLDPQPGETIWDMCAAPGGKTAYMGRLMNETGRILATDVHANKTKTLSKLLTGSLYTVKRHDSASPVTEAAFDRVLLDAPCTGLGVVRRHPEIRWRRSPADIAERAHLQRTLLDNAAKAVLPGGVLVYSVCSDAHEEGRDHVEPFLTAHPEFTLEPPTTESVPWADLTEGGCLQLRPHVHGADGFFAARFRHRDAP